MDLIESLENELKVYESVSETFASHWHDIIRQERDPFRIQQILMSQFNSLNLLLGCVNKNLPYAERKLEYINTMKKIVESSLRVMDSTGKSPPHAIFLVDSLIVDLGSGDLDYCTHAYYQVRSGKIGQKDLCEKTRKLFNIFEREDTREIYYRKHGCARGRAKLAGVYLEGAEPLICKEDFSVEELYGGHFSAFKKIFADRRREIIKKVTHDLNLWRKPLFYPRISFACIIRKEIEDYLNSKEELSYIG